MKTLYKTLNGGIKISIKNAKDFGGRKIFIKNKNDSKKHNLTIKINTKTWKKQQQQLPLM